MQGNQSIVELHLEVRNLIKMDRRSKSDPAIEMLALDESNGQWKRVGKTECVQDAVDCKFSTALRTPFVFSRLQPLLFNVYDVDDPKKPLEKQELIGSVSASLSEIVGNVSHSIVREIITRGSKRKNGQLCVSAEEVRDVGIFFRITFAAKNLDKKDTFGKSDPFFTILRQRPDGGSDLVHKSEVIKKTLNPEWKQFNISSMDLCGSNYDRTLVIEVYDWDSDGTHDLIGSFSCNAGLLKQNVGGSIPVINEALSLKKKKYVNSGFLQILQFEEFKEPTLFDYVQNGYEISLAISIDFTGSNGNPATPGTLHYVSDKMNEYQLAILAVGNILRCYDADDSFPTFGFGARFGGKGQSVSHLSNLAHPEPECKGIEGVLESYRSTLQHIILSGPTNLAPTLQEMNRRAAKVLSASQKVANHRLGKKYYVLLVITDGVVTDMPETVEAIVQASRLPISIILVGVGAGSEKDGWDRMNFLDGDDGALTSKVSGRSSVRDCVQFVPFRKFASSGNPVLLAHEVLAEVPNQFLTYMKQHKITVDVK